MAYTFTYYGFRVFHYYGIGIRLGVWRKVIYEIIVRLFLSVMICVKLIRNMCVEFGAKVELLSRRRR